MVVYDRPIALIPFDLIFITSTIIGKVLQCDHWRRRFLPFSPTISGGKFYLMTNTHTQFYITLWVISTSLDFSIVNYRVIQKVHITIQFFLWIIKFHMNWADSLYYLIMLLLYSTMTEQLVCNLKVMTTTYSTLSNKRNYCLIHLFSQNKTRLEIWSKNPPKSVLYSSNKPTANPPVSSYHHVHPLNYLSSLHSRLQHW